MIDYRPPGENLNGALSRFQALPCGCVPALETRRCHIGRVLLRKLADARENWTREHVVWFGQLLADHLEGKRP